ncbi:GIY-YIG nuclease family protein [Gryllotalpicola ginsengisoli]|uniref:GIY-YIG nuclease family protein n=1 Tax=Gryllotalpicola ginsengisoli TaxID=444608 RepID=UPI000489E059|nr:GIY-YIG nuclease family protein [Gryllotalpicola ginsengisoli]
MSGYTYMLRCADGSYYVGSTSNLDARMDQHGAGKGSAYTSKRMPVELVFVAEFDSVADAWAMERRIHGWSRAKKEALIRGDWNQLQKLARRGGGQATPD